MPYRSMNAVYPNDISETVSGRDIALTSSRHNLGRIHASAHTRVSTGPSKKIPLPSVATTSVNASSLRVPTGPMDVGRGRSDDKPHCGMYPVSYLFGAHLMQFGTGRQLNSQKTHGHNKLQNASLIATSRFWGGFLGGIDQKNARIRCFATERSHWHPGSTSWALVAKWTSRFQVGYQRDVQASKTRVEAGVFFLLFLLLGCVCEVGGDQNIQLCRYTWDNQPKNVCFIGTPGKKAWRLHCLTFHDYRSLPPPISY